MSGIQSTITKHIELKSPNQNPKETKWKDMQKGNHMMETTSNTGSDQHAQHVQWIKRQDWQFYLRTENDEKWISGNPRTENNVKIWHCPEKVVKY